MNLAYNQIQISSSPANGKQRVITVNGIIIRPDLQSIVVLTNRTFVDVSGNTLSGVDYQDFEFNIIADNNRLCNPANGLRVYEYPVSGATGNTVIYKDVHGSVVNNPIGFYNFFKPLLYQPVSTMSIVLQNITLEDQVYKSWD